MKLLGIIAFTATATACFIAWHACNIASHAIANNFELGQ
jgi:hypothetical protein